MGAPRMTHSTTTPVALAMWDFSWLERRWPGAGYEDWEQALDELTDRGYDTVRIDAYPHLVAAGPYREWELVPVWNQQMWGAPAPVRVRVLPALIAFLTAARRHGVAVILSSWFREDVEDTRMWIRSPQDLAGIWVETLRHLDQAGLLDTVLFVDLCNEFPLDIWAPFLYSDPLIRRIAPGEPGRRYAARSTPEVAVWMRSAIDGVRTVHPDLDLTFSVSTELATWPDQEVGFLDVLEVHVWMANSEFGDYDRRVGYHQPRFSDEGYRRLARHGREEYERDRLRHDEALFTMIDTMADWSRAVGKPLYTSECWSLVDYKDWPGLEWDWILDLNARAVEYAAGTGRWAGMATSNFCGPQFVGMWREVEWHRRLTRAITSATLDADLADTVPSRDVGGETVAARADGHVRGSGLRV